MHQIVKQSTFSGGEHPTQRALFCPGRPFDLAPVSRGTSGRHHGLIFRGFDLICQKLILHRLSLICCQKFMGRQICRKVFCNSDGRHPRQNRHEHPILKVEIPLFAFSFSLDDRLFSVFAFVCLPTCWLTGSHNQSRLVCSSLKSLCFRQIGSSGHH